MTTRFVSLLWFAAIAGWVGMLSAPGASASVHLEPGDLLVIESSTWTVSRVNSQTGEEAPISSEFFSLSIGIAVSAADGIFVGQPGAKSIVRVDADTGRISAVSAGGLLVKPAGVAVESPGELLVADTGARAIIRVDVATGAQTTLSSGGLIGSAYDIVVNPNGQIFMTNFGGSLLQIDPTTGAQRLVASGAFLGLGLGSAGNLLVTTGGVGHSIIQVEPVSGTQTVVSSGGAFQFPHDVVAGLDGYYYVTDSNAPGAIFRVNPLTGSQIALQPGPEREFRGIAVLLLPVPIDRDRDGVSNDADNCPYVSNTSQTDNDGDGVGDLCDDCPDAPNDTQADADFDAIGNACDNCPNRINRNQSDTDSDTFGDACDNCPEVSNDTQADGDSDTVGDACDNCPTIPNRDQNLEACSQQCGYVSINYWSPLGKDSATVSWTITNEVDLLGFNVVTIANNGRRIQQNSSLIPCDYCVTGAGSLNFFVVPKHKNGQHVFIEMVRIPGIVDVCGPAEPY